MITPTASQHGRHLMDKKITLDSHLPEQLKMFIMLKTTYCQFVSNSNCHMNVGPYSTDHGNFLFTKPGTSYLKKQAIYALNFKIHSDLFVLFRIISELSVLQVSPVCHLSSDTLVTKMYAYWFSVYTCAQERLVCFKYVPLFCMFFFDRAR